MTLAFKFGLGRTYGFIRSVEDELVSVFHEALREGEEMWCRDLARELEKRNMRYKYTWDIDNPLTVWERSV